MCSCHWPKCPCSLLQCNRRPRGHVPAVFSKSNRHRPTGRCRQLPCLVPACSERSRAALDGVVVEIADPVPRLRVRGGPVALAALDGRLRGARWLHGRSSFDDAGAASGSVVRPNSPTCRPWGQVQLEAAERTVGDHGVGAGAVGQAGGGADGTTAPRAGRGAAGVAGKPGGGRATGIAMRACAGVGASAGTAAASSCGGGGGDHARTPSREGGDSIPGIPLGAPGVVAPYCRPMTSVIP